MQTSLIRHSAIATTLTSTAARRLLQQLARAREQLFVRLPADINEPVVVDHETTNATTLTLLPILRPSADLRAVASGSAIQLHGRLSGAPFDMATAVRIAELDDTGGQLVCDMPQNGTLHERRALPRFPVPPGPERAVAVVHLPGEVMLCRPVDISRAGVRLRLETPDVDIGDLQVVYCELRRGTDLLQSMLDLRWKRFAEGHLHFGGPFLARETAFVNTLDRLVAESERHWLRQRGA